MVRTQISLEEGMYAEAREKAHREGVSFAELVRRALTRMLNEPNTDGPTWRALAGAIEGHEDDSQSVDDVVYGRHRP